MTAIVPLGSVATVTMGLSPLGDTYNSTGEGLPLLNGPTEFGPSHPSPTLFTVDPKRRAEVGDLLFCVRGSTTGRMNWADREYAIGRGIASIRGRSRLETRYIKYCIDFGLRGLLQQASGSTFPNLGVRQISELGIPYRDDRFKVAALLSAYDDLIENNLRRIKVLGQMAQRIYREWFVDFRYPTHDAPRLVESEIGHVPTGWQVMPLRDLCTRVVDGDWIETKDQGGHDYRLLQVSNIGTGQFRETGNFRYITKETFDRLRCTEVRPGFVLVSRMPDPIGRAWFVDHLAAPAITAVDVAILEPDETMASGRFIAFSLNTERNLAHAAVRATGTTRPRITRKDLETFPVLVPSRPFLDRFSEFLDVAGELQLRLGLQTRSLQEARDLLLPRLVSGAVDLEDLDIATDDRVA